MEARKDDYGILAALPVVRWYSDGTLSLFTPPGTPTGDSHTSLEDVFWSIVREDEGMQVSISITQSPALH